MSAYAVVGGRIRRVLADLDRVVERVEELLEKARHSGDDAYFDGAALNLHGFYSGVERIFETVAHEIDGHLPNSPHWHRDLLHQMSAEIPNVRPAVIHSETRDCLDEYRTFRHIVRNVYTFNFRPQRIKELAEQVHDCYDALAGDLEVFVGFLEQLDAENAS